MQKVESEECSCIEYYRGQALPFTFSAVSWLIGEALSSDKVIIDIIITVMVITLSLCCVPSDVGDKVPNQRHQQGR